LVTGSGVATAGFVYKLVARESSNGWEPVAKKSIGKGSVGGRKWAARRHHAGVAVEEHVYAGHAPAPRDYERPLLVPAVRDGEVVESTSLVEAREHCRRAIGELPDTAMALSTGDPALDVVIEELAP
jgi:nicotinate phosphoribosyltransferase